MLASSSSSPPTSRTLATASSPRRRGGGSTGRKPKPGMLRRAARRFGISLADSVLVGDRASDIAAGKAAGCRTIFIDRRYGDTGKVEADIVVRSLPAAVRLISAGASTRPHGG